MKKTKPPYYFWLIVTIALLPMLGPFTIDAYLPSFPSIEQDFQISRSVMLQSIGFYLIASALSTLFWGALSDSIGRMRVIMSSLALYLIASVGCSLAQNYDSFLLFRVLQGVAASGGMVTGRAMVRDLFDPREAHRVMSYGMMLFALAPAIAPIIGGWLYELFGWRSVFYFLVCYAVLVSVLSLVFLSESLAVAQRHSFHPFHVAKVYCSTFCHARFAFLVLSIGVSFAGLFIYIPGAPSMVFDILGLHSQQFWVLFVPLTAGIMLGSYTSGKLSHHYTSARIVKLAFYILISASLLNIVQAYWLSPTPMTVISPMFLYAFGIALCLPGFSLLALDCFPHNRGSASAVQSFVQTIFAALTTSLLVPLIAADIMNFALTQTACLLVGLLFWISAMRRQP